MYIIKASHIESTTRRKRSWTQQTSLCQRSTISLRVKETRNRATTELQHALDGMQQISTLNTVRTHLCHSGVVLQQICQYSGIRRVHSNLREHQCIASSEISDVLVCVHDGRQGVFRNPAAPGMYLCTSDKKTIVSMKNSKKMPQLNVFCCLRAALNTKRTCVIVVLLFRQSAKALPPSTPRLFELTATCVQGAKRQL